MLGSDTVVVSAPIIAALAPLCPFLEPLEKEG